MPEVKDVQIQPYGLPGNLVLPGSGMGLVLFAHGSGSGRLSPRNRHVAEALQAAGLGPLLFDLLTEEEAGDRTNVFDIFIAGKPSRRRHRIGPLAQRCRVRADRLFRRKHRRGSRLEEQIMTVFADRGQAGRLLAGKIVPMALERPLLLALPRGGVPIAAEVAAALDAPLDVLFVRKIGLPSHPEYAIAAVVDGAHPQMVRNEHVLGRLQVDESYVLRECDRELAEIERRRKLYCGDRSAPDVEGRTVLVVDDGVATGTTVRAALKALRRSGVGRLILAVPVIAPDTAREFRDDGIEVVSVIEPADFRAVGQFYRDFHQLKDEEVIDLLRKSTVFE